MNNNPRAVLRERLLSIDDEPLPRSPLYQPTSQSTNQSIRPSRATSISSLADGERDPLTPLTHSRSTSFSQINHLDLLSNQSVNQSINQPTGQWTNQSIDNSGLAPRPMMRATSAPYNQPVNQSINQSTSHLTAQSSENSDEKYFYLPVNQPINQSVSPRRRTADAALPYQSSINQSLMQTPHKDYRSLHIDVRGRRRAMSQSNNQSGQSTPRSDVSPTVELSSPSLRSINQSNEKHRSLSNASILSPYIPRAYSTLDPSNNQSINQSIGQLNDNFLSIDSDVDEHEDSSIYLSINHSNNQPVNQATHRSKLRSPSFRSMHHKNNQSINQLINQSVSRRQSRYVKVKNRRWWQCFERDQSGKIPLKSSIKQSFRFLLFIIFFCALLLICEIIFLQFRTVALYNNQVCRAINHQSINESIYSSVETHQFSLGMHYDTLTQSINQPINQPMNYSEVHVGPSESTRSFAEVILFFFSSIFGVFSLLFYSVFSVLGALSPRIRVPSVYQSINQTFVPDYTDSPLLDLPINFFRVGGSHNSYHLPSSFPLPPHQYGHAPLLAQLGDETDGTRSLELDIHLLGGEGGMIMYHLQMIDDHTNCYCLIECLHVVRIWLKKWSQSYPIYLLVEIKRELYEDFGVGLTGITCNDIFNINIAFRSVFASDEFLLPSQVRGAFPSVSQALLYQNYWQRLTNHFNNTPSSQRPSEAEIQEMEPLTKYANASQAYGWPRLGDMLGKVLFIWLDDVHNYADRLTCITDDPSSEYSLMFIAQAHANRSYSAVQISRNPILDFVPPIVEAALKHGLILRTLSTTASFKGLHRDFYYAAVESGIHIISTDFEPPCLGNVRSVNETSGAWIDWNEDDRWCERLPSGWPFECHPFLAPSWCETELRRVRQPAVTAAINRTNVDPDPDHQHDPSIEKANHHPSDVDKYAPKQPLVRWVQHRYDDDNASAKPRSIDIDQSTVTSDSSSNHHSKEQVDHLSKDPSRKSTDDLSDPAQPPIVTIQLH